MAHGITDEDKVVSGNRVPMWHKLGAVVDGQLTREQTLEYIGWKVEQVDLQSADGRAIAFPDRVGLVRSDTARGLAVVGTQYTPVQNDELLDFAFKLVEASKQDAIVETAGSLFGGRRVWALVRIPKDIRIGGKDPVQQRILVANGHDGVLAFHARAVATRVVCANTLNAALREAADEFKLKHTESITSRLQQAREAMNLTFAYYGDFAKLMERLTEKRVTDARFEKIVAELLPIPPSREDDWRREQERERVARQRLALLGVYRDSPTVDRGTAYGAYNAVTEWIDHVKDATKSGEKADSAVNVKVNKMWFGQDRALKTRALELIAAK